MYSVFESKYSVRPDDSDSFSHWHGGGHCHNGGATCWTGNQLIRSSLSHCFETTQQMAILFSLDDRFYFGCKVLNVLL